MARVSVTVTLWFLGPNCGNGCDILGGEMQDIVALLNGMIPEEQVAVLSGADFWSVAGNDRQGSGDGWAERGAARRLAGRGGKVGGISGGDRVGCDVAPGFDAGDWGRFGR